MAPGFRPSGSEPFVFRMTEDKLRECRGMTAEEKLRWLNEANAFVRAFLSPEQRARWARFVDGRGDARETIPDDLAGDAAPR